MPGLNKPVWRKVGRKKEGEMENEGQSYMGVDVAKDALDVLIRGDKNPMHASNDDAGVQKVIRLAKKRQVKVVCFEYTGGYEVRLWEALTKEGIKAAPVNPRYIRHFAQSDGRLAKTDAIDARVIADYAAAMDPRTVLFPQTAGLKDVVSRLAQLQEMCTAERNRLQMARDQSLKDQIQGHIDWLEKEMKELHKHLKSDINESPEWRQKDELLRSMPGVGEGLSSCLIARLPELGFLTRQKIAALVGVAPLNRDSGHHHGKRSVWGGRGPIRAILYMSALVATRHNPVIKRFYDRLVNSGKSKKLALTACMRKLLTILNAMVKTNTKWSQNYVPQPIDN